MSTIISIKYIKRTVSKVLLLLSFITFLTGCETKNEIPITKLIVHKPLGIAFPPYGTISALETAEPYLKELQIDRIKMSVNWKFIEKTKGNYSWSNLDYRISFYNTRQIKVFITIDTQLPDYLSGNYSEISGNELTEFTTFIHAFVERYHNKIYLIQVGNEWDGWGGFAGSAEDYTQLNNVLYNEVKAITNTLPVVLGGINAYLPYQTIYVNNQNIHLGNRQLYKHEQFLLNYKIKAAENKQKGIDERVTYVFRNANYDMVDIHLYDEAELFSDYITIVKQLTDKQLIVSEFGAPNPQYELYNESYQTTRLIAIWQSLNSLDVEEVYHFSLIDSEDAYHCNNGLLSKKKKKKTAYYLYQNRTDN